MHQENVKKTAYLTVFFSLYIAQAVPMSFFTTALQVILREQAVPLSIIGLLQVIKLPWILKVFWAPAVDRHCNTIRDYKRTIVGVEIVYTLLVLLTSIFNLGAIVPSSFHFLIVIILLALMASATQDIATDALAIRTSSHKQRGLLNSMQSMGSFGGSLLGSGVLLMVLHKYGWSRVAQCLSVFVLIALIPLLLHKKLAFQQESKVKQRATWKDFGLFFRQKGISRQVIFLVLYYTGIIGVMSMLKPFMVDLGYSMKEIGFLCGIVGIGSAFVMAYPAGLFVRRWGYKRMRDLCFHYVSLNNILCVAVLIPSNNLAVNACHCCALGQLWHGNSSRLHVIYATCACRKGGNRLHSANRYHTSHGDSHLHYLRNHRQ